jgi:hypothetical protein
MLLNVGQVTLTRTRTRTHDARTQFLYWIFDNTSLEIALSLNQLERIEKSTNFQESNYNLLIYNALQRKIRAFPP